MTDMGTLALLGEAPEGTGGNNNFLAGIWLPVSPLLPYLPLEARIII